MPAVLTSGHAASASSDPVADARSPGIGGFFRYHGVWAPGVRLFRKLDFPAKAAIISVAFLIPLLVLAWSYASAYFADEHFVQAERQGVAYAQPLVKLMAAATRERQLARVQARGEAVPDLPKVREQVDALWAQLQTLDQQDRALLASAAAFDKAREAWLTLRKQSGGTPEQLFLTYSAAIDLQQQLLEWVVDHSNLALDPEIGSYYLLYATLVAAPDLFHSAGRLRGPLTSAAKDGQIKRGDWLRIEDELQLVTRRTEQVQASVDKARQSNALALKNLVLDDIVKQSKALQELARAAVTSEQVSFSATDATQRGNALAAASLLFIEQGTVALDGLLALRQSHNDRAFKGLMTLSVGCVLLAAYLLKCFTWSPEAVWRRCARTWRP